MRRKLLDVVVQAEDGTCEKECLGDVEDKAVWDIIYPKQFYKHHHDGWDNEQNGTWITNNQAPSSSPLGVERRWGLIYGIAIFQFANLKFTSLPLGGELVGAYNAVPPSTPAMAVQT